MFEDTRICEIMTNYRQYVDEVKKTQIEIECLPDNVRDSINEELQYIAISTSKENTKNNDALRKIFDDTDKIFNKYIEQNNNLPVNELYEKSLKQELEKVDSDTLNNIKDFLSNNNFQKTLVKDQEIDKILSGHDLVKEFSETSKCDNEKREMTNAQQKMEETIKTYSMLNINIEKKYNKEMLELEKSIIKQNNIIKQARQQIPRSFLQKIYDYIV
jgi:DNA-binding protein Fis